MMGFSSVNNFFKWCTQIPWATPESPPHPNSLKQRDLHRKNYRSFCSGFRSCQDSKEFNILTDHEEAELKDPYTSQTCFLQLCSHSGLIENTNFWLLFPSGLQPLFLLIILIIITLLDIRGSNSHD